jgi:hypothetical protein
MTESAIWSRPEGVRLPCWVRGARAPSKGCCYSRVARAAALRPLAIQVILPDWVVVSDEEALDFLLMMGNDVRDVCGVLSPGNGLGPICGQGIPTTVP